VGDRAWVRRILAGERVAAEQLVTRQYPREFRLLCHLTGNRESSAQEHRPVYVIGDDRIDFVQARYPYG
jgi:hypothetical protein